jgi:hypothetical protein
VDISIDSFRKHFAGLSDEALLEQPREDLVPAAQACLDEELTARGLARTGSPEEIPAPADEETITIADFESLPEAEVAQGLLEADGIPATIVHQDTTGLTTPAANGVALAVGVSQAARAQAVLQQGFEISDEELAAQAEAAGPAEDLSPEPE